MCQSVRFGKLCMHWEDSHWNFGNQYWQKRSHWVLWLLLSHLFLRFMQAILGSKTMLLLKCIFLSLKSRYLGKEKEEYWGKDQSHFLHKAFSAAFGYACWALCTAIECAHSSFQEQRINTCSLFTQEEPVCQVEPPPSLVVFMKTLLKWGETREEQTDSLTHPALLPAARPLLLCGIRHMMGRCCWELLF